MTDPTPSPEAMEKAIPYVREEHDWVECEPSNSGKCQVRCSKCGTVTPAASKYDRCWASVARLIEERDALRATLSGKTQHDAHAEGYRKGLERAAEIVEGANENATCNRLPDRIREESAQ